jgi:hypothetical protein
MPWGMFVQFKYRKLTHLARATTLPLHGREGVLDRFWL